MTEVQTEVKEVVYDVPIAEVAEILGKSDRQVRRYVRERRLEARPVRVDGRIKLMFAREEVEAFGRDLAAADPARSEPRTVVVNGRLIEEERTTTEASQPPAGDNYDTLSIEAVKYAIDALREEIQQMRKQNEELHYQLEQRSGQVGFLQSKVEMMQEEMKMLMPSQESRQEVVRRKPWYRRLFGGA